MLQVRVGHETAGVVGIRSEAVLFAAQDIPSDNASLISSADPSIYTLAVVGEQSESTRHASLGTYHIVERNIMIEKGKGFLAWLIAKARFNAQKEENLQSCGADMSMTDTVIEDGKSEKTALGNGETKVLI